MAPSDSSTDVDTICSYRSNPDLENLLFDDFFNKAIHKVMTYESSLWNTSGTK
jgi:hypothetical protein